MKQWRISNYFCSIYIFNRCHSLFSGFFFFFFFFGHLKLWTVIYILASFRVLWYPEGMLCMNYTKSQRRNTPMGKPIYAQYFDGATNVQVFRLLILAFWPTTTSICCGLSLRLLAFRFTFLSPQSSIKPDIIFRSFSAWRLCSPCSPQSSPSPHLLFVII